MTREEFICHMRRFEERTERFAARNPSRDELLEFIRFQLSARIMVAELDMTGRDLARLIEATPIFEA